MTQRKTLILLGALLAAVFAVLLLPGPETTTPPAVASTPTAIASATVDNLASPAQSALDQILGAHHAIVTASATYSQAKSILTKTYDPKHVAALAQANATAPGYRSSVTDNGVSQSLTSTQLPGGQVQRLSVVVVVDSSLRPAPTLTSLRRTVSAAMGLQPRRGDTLTITRMAIAAPSQAPVQAQARSMVALAGGYLPSGVAGIVAVILLLGSALKSRGSSRSRIKPVEH